MFSVVMATYNGSRYIEKQIETIILQTIKPDELIVADDCSTDDTLEIVERMRPKVSFPLTVRRNRTRLGYGDNFLNACELASQPYICFCDQDDSWLPEKISSYAEMIIAMPNVSLFIHQGEVVDDNLRPTGSNHPRITRDHFQPPLTANLLDRPPGFAMCFARKLFTNHDWRNRPADFDAVNSMTKHDLWIFALANAEGGIYSTSKVLIHYRRHSGNASFYRPGSHFKRRLLQIAAIARPPRATFLETRVKAYREHEAYFERLANTPDLPSDALNRYAAIAQQYRRGLELDAYRLAYHRAARVRRGALLVNGVLAGMYHDGARFSRRSFAQDLATLLRPPLK
jgi:glycosyltransferase involved in cell wall biosynthesis